MFCENCGSPLPDGAKFCAECGTRVASSAPEVPDVILPDVPEVILPDVPDVPEVILPEVGAIPDMSQSILDDSAGSAPSEPSWSTVSQQVSAAPPRSPSDSSSVGYSTVSGYAYVPQDAPASARKPLYRCWWFWLAIVFAAIVIVMILFAALIVFSLRNTMPQTSPPEEIVQSILDQADIPELEIPELAGLPEDFDDAFPLDADDQFTPMETLLEQIEQSLSDTGLEYDVWADEDDWVFVDIWKDGMAELADAAGAGDSAALGDWQAMTEEIRGMSESYLADLLAGGQHNAVCVVSLLDEDYSSLAIAVDGELILDLATGLDEYALLDE